MKKSLAILIIMVVYGCGNPDINTPLFEHPDLTGPKPWTNETFEKTEDDFTFAFISDLTGDERPGIFNVAVAQLNRLDPTFVVCVGDLIEGGTEDTLELTKQWDSFDARVGKLNMPFFYLGGNHDLTNTVMREFWQHRYGADYYYFVYGKVLFLMINSEDMDKERLHEIDLARIEAYKIIRGEVEGKFEDTEYAHMLESKTGAMSEAQLNYFKQVLTEHQDVRWTFVVMHKPLWKRDDDKGLTRLEDVLANRPYTVINGHEHSFSYRQRKKRDYLILGTTGGFQYKDDSMSYDHISLIRMAKDKPVVTHIRMDGIMDETGKIPLGGDTLSFQASKH